MNDKYGTMRSHPKDAGFSLLEILVAMAILSIIVMTLSTIFNQSSQAWDRGLSKSEKAMEGRSALNIIASDLKNAIAMDSSLARISFPNGSGSTMAFTTLGKAEKGGRITQYVSYTGGGSISRKVQLYAADYIGFTNSSGGTLIDSIDSFEILPAWSGTNLLPESVTLTLKLRNKGTSGRVTARSYGPNRQMGGNDDITSEGHN